MDDTIEQALVHLSAQRSAGPSAAEDAGITAEEIRSEASIELPTWQRHPECHGPPEPWEPVPIPVSSTTGDPKGNNSPMMVLANARSGS